MSWTLGTAGMVNWLVFVSLPDIWNNTFRFKLSGLVLALHPANERCHYNVTTSLIGWAQTWLILGLRPANERRRYNVTTSLIGWAQTYNQLWLCWQSVEITIINQSDELGYGVMLLDTEHWMLLGSMHPARVCSPRRVIAARKWICPPTPILQLQPPSTKKRTNKQITL